MFNSNPDTMSQLVKQVYNNYIVPDSWRDWARNKSLLNQSKTPEPISGFKSYTELLQYCSHEKNLLAAQCVCPKSLLPLLQLLTKLLALTFARAFASSSPSVKYCMLMKKVSSSVLTLLVTNFTCSVGGRQKGPQMLILCYVYSTIFIQHQTG